MAGRPKRRARLAKMVAGHKASVHKGKRRCKKCGRRHSVSVHWSHEHGGHKGAHGETAWYGRKDRPQGKRKIRRPAKKRKAVRRKSGTHLGAIKTHRAKRLPKRTAAQMLAMGRAATKKRKGHRSPAQKAATARMLAAAAARRGGGGGRKKARKSVRKSGGGRKKPRSAAQKAATARMLAGLAKKRAGRTSVAHVPHHLVHGHLAKKPKGRGKHRVKAHMAADPGFGGHTLSAADRAHNRALARKFNRPSKSKFG